MAVSLEEVKTFCDQNKNNEDLKKYLMGLFPQTTEPTEDQFKAFLNSEKGRAIYQSELDRQVSKGIDTWKEKTLPKMVQDKVDEKLKELNPEETKEQKLLRETNDRLKKLEDENVREKRTNLIIKELTAKELGVFIGFAEKFIADDDDKTIKNVESFADIIAKYVAEKVKTQLQTRKPTDTQIDLQDPNFKNPFSKEHWNLTEQGNLYKTNPDLAKRLHSEATN